MLQIPALQDPGENHKMSPPKESSEGKLLFLCEEFGEIHVEIGEIEQIFSPNKLPPLDVHSLGHEESGRLQLLAKDFLEIVKDLFYLGGNANFDVKKSGVLNDGEFVGIEKYGVTHGLSRRKTGAMMES